MSTLVRQLIAFDIIKQELEEVSLLNDELDKDSIEDAHLQLLKQCSAANQAIIDSTVDVSEFDFAKTVSQVELEIAVSTKQLLTVHNKLLSWAISFFVAKENIGSKKTKNALAQLLAAQQRKKKWGKNRRKKKLTFVFWCPNK